jgi:DNA-binding CsgD family transcriptional regulator
VIVSRGAELARLDGFLAALRRGEGGSLVIHGEAGIGKTTLLRALAARADDAVTVLGASGAETETGLAFAALADLLGPALDHLEVLPPMHAAALLAALAVAPPIPGDRLAVCCATLGLLRAAGRSRPVLVMVDDFHWVDASSRECIEYAARRAGGRLAVVLAARDSALSQQLRLPELPVGPINDSAAAEFLRCRQPRLAPQVVTAITQAAAGNPLALTELPAMLTAEQASGAAALEFPLRPGVRLRRAFAGRIGALDPLARQALLIAAAHGGPDLAVIAAACRRAGTNVARLTAAEACGLVRLGDGQVHFTHPLVRGAVYQDGPAAERRAAHAALAAALPDDDDRRPGHLAAAAAAPDEAVAVELERAGVRAVARRACAAGADELERAARLTPDPDRASGRLFLAGQAAAGAGLADRALGLLAEAATTAADDLRADAEQLRGRLLVWRGRGAEATTLLVRQAERMEQQWPARAAVMLADAATGATTTNDCREAERLARRAACLLAGAPQGGKGDSAEHALVMTVLGWTLALRGKMPEARQVMAEAALAAAGRDRLGPDWPWLHLLLRARIPFGEFEQALAESAELEKCARDAGALAALGGARLVSADAAFRLGDWALADSAAAETVQLAGDAGQPALAGYARTIRTRLLAARGREHDSRAEALAALQLAESSQIGSGLRFIHGALGFLELSLDRPGAAVTELESAGQLAALSGVEEHTVVPWAPDLVEAYVRQGRSGDARRVLAQMQGHVSAAGNPVAAAAVARCRGLLDDDFEEVFAAALTLDDQRPMPFERARTLLALGRRLHRACRRAEARDHLRAALDAFERLQAHAWAGQAEAELRSAGARRRRGGHDGTLTSQELRVAAAVRRGGSNRDIAASLFLSPKTVEFHLSQIYRKLGVHSRTQLAAALADRDGLA